MVATLICEMTEDDVKKNYSSDSPVWRRHISVVPSKPKTTVSQESSSEPKINVKFINLCKSGRRVPEPVFQQLHHNEGQTHGLSSIRTAVHLRRVGQKNNHDPQVQNHLKREQDDK